MDELDKDSFSTVHVIFPDNLLGVSTLYMKALFSPSMERLGSFSTFWNKYNITTKDDDLRQHIKEKITLVFRDYAYG